MAADALAGLIAELPEGTVVTDPAITEGYRQDRALDPSAGKPMAVVRPRRTEEVQTVLRWATAHQIPVVTRGMGTGLSGGATAVDGGIVLSTEKMRDIVVDPVTRTAVCQPGLLNAEVKKAVAEHSLWYPPDPSSYEICSIGGNIATNAGGLCCVKYGVTTDYVLGVQVVLADGTAVRLPLVVYTETDTDFVPCFTSVQRLTRWADDVEADARSDAGVDEYRFAGGGAGRQWQRAGDAAMIHPQARMG